VKSERERGCLVAFMTSETVKEIPFPPKKVMVATDGSDNAGRAVETAVKLAGHFKAELIIIHALKMTIPALYEPVGVTTPPIDYADYFDFLEKEGTKLVNLAVEHAKREGVHVTGRILKTTSSTVESIIQAASDEGVDLIVVGTRGLGGFRRLMLGSVSSGVVTHAHCNVLVVGKDSHSLTAKLPKTQRVFYRCHHRFILRIENRVRSLTMWHLLSNIKDTHLW